MHYCHLEKLQWHAVFIKLPGINSKHLTQLNLSENAQRREGNSTLNKYSKNEKQYIEDLIAY